MSAGIGMVVELNDSIPWVQGKRSQARDKLATRLLCLCGILVGVKTNPSKETPRAHGIEEAIELFDVGVRLYRERLERENPMAAPEDIEKKIRLWLRQKDWGPNIRVVPFPF